jgi:hypothetical protein
MVVESDQTQHHRTMRLITHNMLCSNVKGVKNGFPLRIEADSVEVIESEFDAEFISMMLEKIDYQVQYPKNVFISILNFN